jgi:hypothetical protein
MLEKKNETVIIHIPFLTASRQGNREKQTPKKPPSGGKI